MFSQVNIEQAMNPCFWLSTNGSSSVPRVTWKSKDKYKSSFCCGLQRSAPQFNETGGESELSCVLTVLRAKLLS